MWSEMWSEHTHDHEYYACERLKERVVGNAIAAGVMIPLMSRAFHKPLELLLRHLHLPTLIATQWLPSSPVVAGVLGGIAGLFENYHSQLAWNDSINLGRAQEPEMWTSRTVLPVLALVVNPFIALKALDGEMKGSDCALAYLENRPFQQWPFFAVLEPGRPSPPHSSARFHVQVFHCGLFSQYCTSL
jgi:hypothetical protein